jgi:type VI secretion system protein ImpB
MQNKLTTAGGFLNTELHFRSMEDFSPVNLIDQVPALKKLFNARNRLSDLLSKMDGNDELDAALQQIVSDTESLKKIKSEGATVNA